MLKKELFDKFQIDGLKGNLQHIKDIAIKKGLEVTYLPDKIQKGWVGKPKGFKQILFERKLLNLNDIKNYTKDGHKDGDGNLLDDKYSMKNILGACTNFVNEMTSLQRVGHEIGKKHGYDITIDRTPKCHPEVAGEGIEYTWAQSKLYIRNLPIKKRKRVKDFLSHVQLALSADKGANLTKELIRKLSARARDYMAAYHILSNDNVTKTHTSISKKEIDKMRKVYRCHQCILDIETKVSIELADCKSETFECSNM